LPPVDNHEPGRETVRMEGHGSFRDRIARRLGVAYGDGLLSETTLAHRLDVLCGSHVIEPAGLLGDLSPRPSPALPAGLSRLVQSARWALRDRWRPQSPEPMLLALDWDGAEDDLLLGRHLSCDIVLDDLSVSRRHARLRFRDGHWVLQDLQSTNGTLVNRAPVARCQLLPGDEVHVGTMRLIVD
jgi:FHA domain